MSESIFPGYSEYKNQQFVVAFPKLVDVAERGNAEAQCMLGTLYQLGLGIDCDFKKAVEWYERSSQQGYGVATNNLAGICLMQGRREVSQRLYQLSRDQDFLNGPVVCPNLMQ